MPCYKLCFVFAPITQGNMLFFGDIDRHDVHSQSVSHPGTTCVRGALRIAAKRLFSSHCCWFFLADTPMHWSLVHRYFKSTSSAAADSTTAAHRPHSSDNMPTSHGSIHDPGNFSSHQHTQHADHDYGPAPAARHQNASLLMRNSSLLRAFQDDMTVKARCSWFWSLFGGVNSFKYLALRDIFAHR